MTTTDVVQSTDFLIIVMDRDGRRSYRVTHFEVDLQSAVLRPVFDGGKTLRDFSSFASFRLVNPKTEPSWLYRSALHLIGGENTCKGYGCRYETDQHHAAICPGNVSFR
jgi:hypothetical protein